MKLKDSKWGESSLLAGWIPQAENQRRKINSLCLKSSAASRGIWEKGARGHACVCMIYWCKTEINRINTLHKKINSSWCGSLINIYGPIKIQLEIVAFRERVMEATNICVTLVRSSEWTSSWSISLYLSFWLQIAASEDTFSSILRSNEAICFSQSLLLYSRPFASRMKENTIRIRRIMMKFFVFSSSKEDIATIS